MLSKPDFLKKQIIFLESKNFYKLKFKNSNIVLYDENNKVVLQHSYHKIFLIFIYGDVCITSNVIKNAKKFSIPIVFLSYSLKNYFSVNFENKGNFLLREKQYFFNKNFELSKFIVKNKIENQIRLLKSLRYKSFKDKKNISDLKLLLLKVDSSDTYNSLLGLEGNASKIYFSSIFKNMNFKSRKPRVKSDIYNLLLDIGYSYLFNFIEANLELYGFDVYKGFYHKFFYQRKSLVCDLIEPFRMIVDYRLRKSFNLKQINEKEFYVYNNQYFIKPKFNKKYSKIFLKEILKYKEEIFLYFQSFYRSFMKEKSIKDFPTFVFEVKKE